MGLEWVGLGFGNWDWECIRGFYYYSSWLCFVWTCGWHWCNDNDNTGRWPICYAGVSVREGELLKIRVCENLFDLQFRKRLCFVCIALGSWYDCCSAHGYPRGGNRFVRCLIRWLVGRIRLCQCLNAYDDSWLKITVALHRGTRLTH